MKKTLISMATAAAMFAPQAFASVTGHESSVKSTIPLVLVDSLAIAGWNSIKDVKDILRPPVPDICDPQFRGTVLNPGQCIDLGAMFPLDFPFEPSPTFPHPVDPMPLSSITEQSIDATPSIVDSFQMACGGWRGFQGGIKGRC